MILVLVGDFQINEIKPQIEAYFSNWRTGEIPTFPEYKEEDFKAGESVTIEATPVKVFARGYRTPKFGTYDALANEIVSSILSNEQKSGLFDEIVNEGQLMALEAIPFTMEDYGATIFMSVPKILGQSFEEANAILDKAIQRLTSGDFSDELFEGAKNDWILSFDASMEGTVDRAYLLAEVYGNKMDWYEYLNYAKAIKEITKPQLVEIAKKYFDKNYFTLYSKMGKIKPEKLKKPAYDPVIPNNEVSSEFYKKWSEIKSDVAPKELISLKDSIRLGVIKDIGVKIVKNRVNDIFDLDIVWEVGYRQHPELEMLVKFLNSATIENEDLSTFKNQLYALGTSINWELEEHELKLSISGLDKNLKTSLELVNKLLQKPTISISQIKSIGKQVVISRKMETTEMQTQSAVLREYSLFEGNSRYVLQPSAKAFKKASVVSFNELYSQLKNYHIHVNYVGNESTLMMETMATFNLVNGKETSTEYVYPFVENSSKVYYVNDTKGVQSHIVFSSPTAANFDKSKVIFQKTFNDYFGYDMSSILFQEIREFRSLAYSTYGFVREGRNAKNKDIFVSYVGCQGDKSPEALDLLNSLIKNMPIKAERANSLISAVKNSIENSNPGFRDYISLYEQSLMKGYDDNYNLALLKALPELTFDKMVDYYKTTIQPLPLRLSVVGNKTKFDLNVLAKYGKITPIKLSKIYTF
jgi:predicted Zn-dependent peptidase